MPVVKEKRPYQRIAQPISEIAVLSQRGYTPVFSSNVSAVSEDGIDLYIRFHNGSVYKYLNKANKFESILAASSKGKWVWRFLRRPNASFERVSDFPLANDLDVTDEELFEDVTGIKVADVNILDTEQFDIFHALTFGLINTKINSDIFVSNLILDTMLASTINLM